jgi:hypothetical protein
LREQINPASKGRAVLRGSLNDALIKTRKVKAPNINTSSGRIKQTIPIDFKDKRSTSRDTKEKFQDSTTSEKLMQDLPNSFTTNRAVVNTMQMTHKRNEKMLANKRQAKTLSIGNKNPDKKPPLQKIPWS